MARRVPDSEFSVSRAGEEERQSSVEAGVVDGGAVAPENRHGVRRGAAARLFWVGHALRRAEREVLWRGSGGRARRRKARGRGEWQGGAGVGCFVPPPWLLCAAALFARGDEIYGGNFGIPNKLTGS